MNDLKSLSDAELEREILTAVECETKAKIRVLHLLAEAERRRLYSHTYPSLFEYCTRVLKYTGGAAQRRIDTMRAMKLLPEIEAKILKGKLNLMAVSQAQVFFRQEAKIGKVYTVEKKREVLEKLENKSTRECIKELVAISPLAIPRERRRELSATLTEIKIIADQKLVTKLDKLKALLSHENPHMTDLELINVLADITLRKLDPAFKAIKKIDPARSKSKDKFKNKFENISENEFDNENECVNKFENESKSEPKFEPKNTTKSEIEKEGILPALEVKPSFISKAIKKAVFQRDNSTCTQPGCGSTYFLEIDHIKPKALGGDNSLVNLRLLCRTHNQRAAIDLFGIAHMSRFIGFT